MTKAEREAKLRDRLAELKACEDSFHAQGIQYIAGVDEVGRGPLAGPVVTACVVLPADFDVLGVDDSKKVTEKRREVLFNEIKERAIAYGIGSRDNHAIDEVNILNATKEAMKDAIQACDQMLAARTGEHIQHVLIDAVELDGISIPQTPIIKGDATSLSIAAASILAKVTRDHLMIQYAEEYPWYAFEKNKGYGTKAHYLGLDEHGITPIHRMSFLEKYLGKR